MAENTQIAIKKDVGQQVIDRVNKLCEVGFVMPPDYNYINAIKASMLELQTVVDKNKRPALEVCTPVSIQSFLFNMCTKGLDVSKKTCYPIVRGDKLCLHVSYFGHILQVKRLFPNWTPVAHTIREGDEFVYTVNPENGKMKLVKHEQKLENIDNDFVGAYMYLPCADGEPELYVMTKKQILKAWSKSSSQNLQVHKDFDDKMAIRTLINSGCPKVINATPDPISIPDDSDDPNNVSDPVNGDNAEQEYVDFEDVNENDNQEQQQLPENTAGSKNELKKENDDEF